MVRILFVLSRYVIARVADTEGNGARDFRIGRVTRIRTVAIHAVPLAPPLDPAAMATSPGPCAQRSVADLRRIRFPASLTPTDEH